MLPSIFGENLFDDFFSDPFEMMMPQSRNPLYGIIISNGSEKKSSNRFSPKMLGNIKHSSIS